MANVEQDQAAALLVWLGNNGEALRKAAGGGEVFVRDAFIKEWSNFGNLARAIVKYDLAIKPAPTIRQYNREECEALVGRAFRCKLTGYVHAVAGFVVNRISMCHDGNLSPMDLLEQYEHLDGSPCGVKEGE